MIEVAVMIEGQNGLNLARWQRMARAVESLGFVGLYRSDHYTNAGPPDKDSLELWISLAWLASHTQRIEFGPMVTPFSFRDPSMTARMATAVDDLSGGRMTLGVGAGWQEREHEKFGWDLLDIAGRFERFEDGLEIVTRLLRSDEPTSYEGKHYQLRDAVMLPRPMRPGGPPLLIGGNGPRRTLPLTARFAVEWNGLFLTPERYSELSARLDDLLEENGRGASAVKRSLMTGCYFGRTDDIVAGKLRAGRTKADYRAAGVVVGTASEVVEQLEQLHAAGVQRIMLQWLDLDDLDGLEGLATLVLPQLR